MTVRSDTGVIDYYNAHADVYAKRTCNADMHQTRTHFLNALAGAFPELPRSRCRILDFGCGSGRDTKEFLSLGYQASALDGSEKLAALASAYTGIPVRCCLFQNFGDHSCYEGIWACASLLHLTAGELQDVLVHIKDALVPGGILYASFKYGSGEQERSGRYYLDLNEKSVRNLIQLQSGLLLTEQWISGDVLPGREDERWLNLLLQRKKKGYLGT